MDTVTPLPSGTPDPTEPPKSTAPEPTTPAAPILNESITPITALSANPPEPTEPPKIAVPDAATPVEPIPANIAFKPITPLKPLSAGPGPSAGVPTPTTATPAKVEAAKSTETPAESVSPFEPASAEPKVSQTARVTKSNWSLLGRTQGQRGAEVLAAIRGKFDPTPEHIALKRGGAESLITAYIKDPVSIAVVIGRPKYFQALVEREIAGVEAPLIVEMASGFLPRALILAREHPTWQVIEVDLPDVIHEKRVRYTLNNIPIPPNLDMKAADLGVTPLKDVIGDRKADLVIAEGLMPYFDATDQQNCAKYVAECLRPNGKFIFDITWVHSIVSNNDISNMMKRQAGNFLIGYVESVEEAKTRYSGLGYETIVVNRPLQMETEIPGLPSIMVDAVLLVIARKGA